MVALPEWLGNLSSLQKLYIVDCNRLLHLPTEEAMRQLKTLEIYDCPNLEGNDHIPFVDTQDSAIVGKWFSLFKFLFLQIITRLQKLLKA